MNHQYSTDRSSISSDGSPTDVITGIDYANSCTSRNGRTSTPAKMRSHTPPRRSRSRKPIETRSRNSETTEMAYTPRVRWNLPSNLDSSCSNVSREKSTSFLRQPTPPPPRPRRQIPQSSNSSVRRSPSIEFLVDYHRNLTTATVQSRSETSISTLRASNAQRSDRKYKYNESSVVGEEDSASESSSLRTTSPQRSVQNQRDFEISIVTLRASNAQSRDREQRVSYRSNGRDNVSKSLDRRYIASTRSVTTSSGRTVPGSFAVPPSEAASGAKARLAVRLQKSRDRSRSHSRGRCPSVVSRSLDEQVQEVNGVGGQTKSGYIGPVAEAANSTKDHSTMTTRIDRLIDSYDRSRSRSTSRQAVGPPVATASRPSSRSRSRSKSTARQSFEQQGLNTEAIQYDSARMRMSSYRRMLWDQISNHTDELDYDNAHSDYECCEYKYDTRNGGNSRAGHGRKAIGLAVAVLPGSSDEEESSSEDESASEDDEGSEIARPRSSRNNAKDYDEHPLPLVVRRGSTCGDGGHISQASDIISFPIAVLPASSDDESVSEREREEQSHETAQSRRKTAKRQGSRSRDTITSRNRVQFRKDSREKERGAILNGDPSSPPRLDSSGCCRTTERRRTPIKENHHFWSSQTELLHQSGSLVGPFSSNLDAVPYEANVMGRKSTSARAKRRSSLRSTTANATTRVVNENRFCSPENYSLHQPGSLVDPFSSIFDEVPCQYEPDVRGRRSTPAHPRTRASLTSTSATNRAIKEDRSCSSETDLLGQAGSLADPFFSNLDELPYQYEADERGRISASALARRRSSHKRTCTSTTNRANKNTICCSSETDLLGQFIGVPYKIATKT